MDFEEAKTFVAGLRWQWVKDPRQQPHEYSILGWPGLDKDRYWQFARLVKREGYLGWYRGMVNSYLRIDGYYFWCFGGNQICRTRDRQHEVLPEQLTLE